jgi:hypothetical protein
MYYTGAVNVNTTFDTEDDVVVAIVKACLELDIKRLMDIGDTKWFQDANHKGSLAIAWTSCFAVVLQTPQFKELLQTLLHDSGPFGETGVVNWNLEQEYAMAFALDHKMDDLFVVLEKAYPDELNKEILRIVAMRPACFDGRVDIITKLGEHPLSLGHTEAIAEQCICLVLACMNNREEVVMAMLQEPYSINRGDAAYLELAASVCKRDAPQLFDVLNSAPYNLFSDVSSSYYEEL